MTLLARGGLYTSSSHQHRCLQPRRHFLSAGIRTMDDRAGPLRWPPLRLGRNFRPARASYRVCRFGPLPYLSSHTLWCHSDPSLVIHSIVRVSLGAMSTREDVDSFLDFLRSTFIENNALSAASTLRSIPSDATLKRDTSSLEPPDDPALEFPKFEREKPRRRHIPLLSHLRRPPKAPAKPHSFLTKNLGSVLPTIR